MLDETVVLGVEHEVDGRQADVLVAAAVTGDVVRAEQFVVVLRRGQRGRVDHVVEIGSEGCAGRARLRRCAVRDVVEERVAGVQRERRVHGVVRVALEQGRLVELVEHHDLRVAVRTGDEPTVRVGRQQRDLERVEIVELDAEHVARLLLDAVPRDQATGRRVVEQMTGRHRAVRRRLVLAQERLVRRVRRVGLVLVDERCDPVRVLPDIVRRADDAVFAGLVGGPGQADEVRPRGR